MIIKAAEKNVCPNSDVTVQLKELFRELAKVQGDKQLVFEKGEYYINANDCEEKVLYITNSTGDREWKRYEKPRLNKIALCLDNISDLTIQGNGAEFIIDGRVTNLTCQDCKNVTVSDIIVSVVNPDMHDLKVVKVGKFSVDFEVDKYSKIRKCGSGLEFYGNGYASNVAKNALNAYWNGYVAKSDQNVIKRVAHPLGGIVGIKEIAPNVMRAKYIFKRKFNVGDTFCIFDARRSNAGIFVNKSQNISFVNITQNFNYGLSFVGQDSQNITVQNCTFAPKNQEKLMSSVADFMQICMCKGDVIIKDNYFEGAGDDCLNAHGVHFKVSKIKGNQITVKFCHVQTLGYNPLEKGDDVEFTNAATLMTKGSAKIVDSKMIDNYTIQLSLDNVDNLKVGDVIEDITKCPNVYFENNKMTRIITRGLLLTTRGKVVVRNNEFVATTMNGILLSDDAKSWYESGPCRDVLIEGNKFGYCPEYTVCIMPENRAFSNPIHSNIIIKDNVINSQRGGLYIANAVNVVVENNNFVNKNPKIVIKNAQVDMKNQANF